MYTKSVITSSQIDLTDDEGNLLLEGGSMAGKAGDIEIQSGIGVDGGKGGDLILTVSPGGKFISSPHIDAWARVISDVIIAAQDELKDKETVHIRMGMSGVGVEVLQVLVATNKVLEKKSSLFRLDILTEEDHIVKDAAGIWGSCLILKASVREVELIDLVYG